MDNLVAGCYMVGRRKQINDWQEVDEETSGLVSALTYIILFVNDQVYNHVLMLGDVLKPSNLYRQKVKMTFNTIDKEIKAYNFRINDIAGVRSDILASITQSMEDDIKPHIDKYFYAVSNVLLRNGITGVKNQVASLASTINMLCQVSCLCVTDFGNRICTMYHRENNPLTYLKQDRIEKLSEELSNMMVDGVTKINLNDEPTISVAFKCIMSNMLSPKVFENAFTSYQEDEKE